MKKKFTILGLTLVAVIMSVMCVFTACNQIDSSTYVEPSAKSLAEMIKTIELEHKTDVKNSTPSSYKVAEKAIYGEELAYIKWTAKVETEGANENDVTVSAPADNFIMIVINDKSRIEFTYTLTATLTNKNGVEYKKEDGSLYTATFTHTVPAYKIVNWEGFKANCEFNSNSENKDNKQTITVKGYIIGIVTTTSSSKGSIYLQDADGYGYYAYNPNGVIGSIKDDTALRAAWPVGTEIEVTGTGTIYNGQYEFEKDCAVKKTGNSVEASALTYRNATEAWGTASSNTDTALIPYQNSLVSLDGCKMTGKDASYYYFTVNGVEYNIYKNNYFMDDAAVTAMLNNYAVGKQATIKGLVSCYNNKYQIYPVGSDCISKVTDAVFTADEKLEAEVKHIAGMMPERFTENGTLALNVKGVTFEDVTIAWSFKDGVAHTSANIDENNNLVVTLGSSTETFTLVATITCGEKTITKEYNIKSLVLKNIEAKIEKADLIKTCKELNAMTEDKKGEIFYVKGTITGYYNNGTSYGNVYIQDSIDGKEFVIYGLYGPDGKTKYSDLSADMKPVPGDFIVVSGPLDIYKSTRQLKNATLLQVNETVVELTAAKKVAAEKDALTFTKDTTKAKLQGATFTDVVISWTSYSELITIAEDGTVTVSAVTSKTTVKVTATLTLGDVTASKEFDITLGDNTQEEENSLENPYTAGEALAKAKELASGVTADKRVYVTGVVSTFELNRDGNGAFKMNIKDENGIEFLIFQCKYTETVTSVKVGDTVVVSGFLCNYNGTTYELSYNGSENCKFESVTEKILTNAEKVAAEKDALTFTAETKTVPLKGTQYEDVKISWSSNNNTAIVIAENGAVTVNNVDADMTVTVTATLTLGEVTDTKTFSIALTKYNPDAPVLTKATITFDDKTKRTSFSTTQQVWTENGITVTNDKAESTTDIADYSNPVRFYKDSTLKIEVGGKKIKKIVFKTSGGKNLTYTGAAGQTVTGSGASGTTIEFTTGVTEFNLTLSSQIRVSSLEITYEA